MSNLGDLYLKISADMKPLKDALGKASAATQEWADKAEASVNKVSKGFNTLKTAIGGALLVGATMKGLQMIGDALDRLDKLDETARKVGVTAERLQELQFAASQTGASSDDMTAALEKLNVQIGQAQNGSGKLDDVLTRYGITLRNTNGTMKSTEQVFNDIVKVLGSIENANERAAIEAAAFGKEAGPNLDILLRQGTAAIEEQARKARELGLVYSNEMVAGAADAKDKVDILKQFIEVQLTTAIADNATAIGNWAMTAIGWITKVIEGFQLLGKVWREKDRDLKVKWVNYQSQEIQKGKGLFQSQASWEKEKAQRLKSQGEAQAVLDRYNEEDRLLRELKSKPPAASPGATAAGNTSGNTGDRAAAAAAAAAAESEARKKQAEIDKRQADVARLQEVMMKGRLTAASKMIDQANEELDALMKQDDALNAQAQAVKDLINPWGELARQVDELNKLQAAGKITEEERNQALILMSKEAIRNNIELTDSQKMLQDLSLELGTTFESAFLNAIEGGKGMSEILGTLINDIGRMIIKAMILQPLMDSLFGKQGSGSSGLMGTVVSAIGGAIGGSMGGGQLAPITVNAQRIPGYAGGGRVNGPTWVGERGPELLIPSGPSRVVNNHAANQMGSPNVKVEVVNRGTPQKATQTNATFDASGAVVRIILDDIQRGGPISNGLGSTYGLRRSVG